MKDTGLAFSIPLLTRRPRNGNHQTFHKFKNNTPSGWYLLMETRTLFKITDGYLCNKGDIGIWAVSVFGLKTHGLYTYKSWVSSNEIEINSLLYKDMMIGKTL